MGDVDCALLRLQAGEKEGSLWPMSHQLSPPYQRVVETATEVGRRGTDSYGCYYWCTPLLPRTASRVPPRRLSAPLWRLAKK